MKNLFSINLYHTRINKFYISQVFILNFESITLTPKKDNNSALFGLKIIQSIVREN